MTRFHEDLNMVCRIGLLMKPFILLTPLFPLLYSGSGYAAESASRFEILAETGHRLLYVDAHATGEGGQDGTRGRPFLTIQQAINDAADGDVIYVYTATYTEHLDLLGKNIHVLAYARSPQNKVKQAWPTIMGLDNRPVIRFTHGEGVDCHIEGFLISHFAGPSGGAVFCEASSPTLSHCLIVGHDTRATQAAVISCRSSHAIFRNCTITENMGSLQAPVIDAINSPIRIHNSIVWGNTSPSLQDHPNQVIQILYSHIADPESGPDEDPLFVQAGQWLARPGDLPIEDMDSMDLLWISGDYHLQSIAGRWSQENRTWHTDNQNSPCIDAGDPTSPLRGESIPAGERVNLGAYGGTLQASKSFIDDRPVYFDNHFIKGAVEEALGIFDPTPADMLNLFTLDASFLWHVHIRYLTGLEYAINLEELYLHNNRLRSVSELAGLTNLRHLDISDCVTISDISGLSQLVHLEHLDMHYNSLWTLTPIKNLPKLHTLIIRRNDLDGNDLHPLDLLPKLTHLDIRRNGFTSLDHLTDVTTLKELWLDGNPWDLSTYDETLEIIKDNNPGILIHD